MEKLLGIAVYFQSSIRSQRLHKDTRESTYLLSVQSGALPFWRQKTGENVLWLGTNKEGENGKNRAAPHFRLLTSHWNAVSCSAPPPTRGPHLESVNAALSCQVHNLHTVLLGALGDRRRGINPIPWGWLGSEGGVQHGKDIKARNVGRIKWNHVWNSKAWSAERAHPKSPCSLRWLVQSSMRPAEAKTKHHGTHQRARSHPVRGARGRLHESGI